jgi:hypothetical protein
MLDISSVYILTCVIALLKMTEHLVNLYMHEVAMHVDHNVESFNAPFTEEKLRGPDNPDQQASRPLTPTHIAALSTCLTSIDGVFEAFMSLDVDTIRALPVMHFVRIAYAVVVLIKMHFAAATPGSELGKVIDKNNMKVEQYLDGLLDKFKATAADNKSRPGSKFLMVLIMLKTWFHRQTNGKANNMPIKAKRTFPNIIIKPPSTNSRKHLARPTRRFSFSAKWLLEAVRHKHLVSIHAHNIHPCLNASGHNKQVSH